MALFGALSCNEPAAPLNPIAISGTYVLVKVDTSSLPTVLYPGQSTAGTVFADTFRLGPSGRGTRTSMIRWDDLSHQTQGNITRQQSNYGYRIVGSRFDLTFVCPIDADCTAPIPMATHLTADGIRIESGTSIVPLLYVRVSSSP